MCWFEQQFGRSTDSRDCTTWPACFSQTGQHAQLCCTASCTYIVSLIGKSVQCLHNYCTERLANCSTTMISINLLLGGSFAQHQSLPAPIALHSWHAAVAPSCTMHSYASGARTICFRNASLLFRCSSSIQSRKANSISRIECVLKMQENVRTLLVLIYNMVCRSCQLCWCMIC